LSESEVQYLTAEVQRLNEIIHKSYLTVSDFCTDCGRRSCRKCKLFPVHDLLTNERHNGGEWHSRRRAQAQKEQCTVRTTTVDGTKIEYWLFEDDAQDRELTQFDRDKLIPSVYRRQDGSIYTEYGYHGWWQKI